MQIINYVWFVPLEPNKSTIWTRNWFLPLGDIIKLFGDQKNIAKGTETDELIYKADILLKV